MHSHLFLLRVASLAALFALGAAALAEPLPPLRDSGEISLADAEAILDDPGPRARRKLPTVVEMLERAVKIAPDNARARMLLARAIFASRGFIGLQEAYAANEEALRLDPRLGEAHALKVQMAIASGCVPCARQALATGRAMAAGDPALLAAEGVLQLRLAAEQALDPAAAPYLPGAGENHAALARDALTKAAQAETRPARKSRMLVWLGDAVMEGRERDAAARYYRQAVEADPENADALTKLAAHLLYVQGNVEAALAPATRAAALEPWGAARQTMAVALYMRWAEGWHKARSSDAVVDRLAANEHLAAARKAYPDTAAVFFIATATAATADLALAMLESRVYDVRQGDYRDQDGDTALGNLVINLGELRDADAVDRARMREVMEALLERGANPNAWVSRGREPMLAHAARAGQAGVVRRLLEAGANVHNEGAEGTTALIAAASGTDSAAAAEITRLLLARSASVSARDSRGQSALMAAARAGHRQVVEALLAAGADPGLEDEREYTALDWAAEQGHRRVAESLLAAGAEVREHVSKCGISDTADIAERNGHKELADLLRSRIRRSL